MMMQANDQLLYQGKTKQLYSTTSDMALRMVFRDDATAFDGKKKATLSQKGMINNALNAHLMTVLASFGIATHFLKKLSDTESLVRHCHMLPVECVVRNHAAGSLCRRLGIPHAQPLSPPLLEFFYKSDALGDPLINASHMQAFGWASQDEIDQMKSIALRVNDCLLGIFRAVDLMLIDFKLEFGICEQTLLLADELTPDNYRVWDVHSKKSLDKDVFRHGSGDMIEAYRNIAQRLGVFGSATIA